MITAYPPTKEPLITGLCDVLNELANAKFYISLEGVDGKGERCGSGFGAKAQDKREAMKEAAAHLAKYPTWQVAKVQFWHRTRCGRLVGYVHTNPNPSNGNGGGVAIAHTHAHR